MNAQCQRRSCKCSNPRIGSRTSQVCESAKIFENFGNNLKLASAAVRGRVARWFILIPKSSFGYILKGTGMENVGIFFENFEYFTAICNSLYPFGIVCVHLVYFSVFGMFGPKKIWQPWRVGDERKKFFFRER
jgi:hypothetical protein